MFPKTAIVSQYRNRSTFAWPARKDRFTEPMRFRNAMNPTRTMRTAPAATTAFLRSAFSYRRTRAFWSSSFGISDLLFHVPDDEDEAELAQWDNEADHDVQEGDDKPGRALADQGHDRHDDHEEERERDDDRHERFGEHAEGLHPLPHLEAVFLLELLGLHEEVRLELPSARGRRHDALEEVLELRGGGALGRLSDRGEDIEPEQFCVPGDPFRLAGDLPVNGLLRELLEDDVHRDVGGGHRGDERHGSRNALVNLVTPLLRHGGGSPVVADGQAEEVHVGEEDRQRRDQAEDYEEGDDIDMQDEEEQRGRKRGDDGAHGGERRVHPGDREIFLGSELDVRLEEVVVELGIVFLPSLNELAEHAPGKVLLRGQTHRHRFRAFGELDHVGGFAPSFSGAEPLRLRQGASGLQLLEGRTSQRSHLRPRPPSGLPALAGPSPRGPAWPSRRDTGNIARRSSRSLGSPSSLSGPCS